MKRIFLGFCCALYAMSASAETWTDPTTHITWPYVIKDGKAIVGTGESLLGSGLRNLTIPKQIAGLDVVGINDWAFGAQTILDPAYRLGSISIPYGVETIGRAAFAGDNSDSSDLREIVLPDSVTEIGESIFWKCRLLESVTLSENLNGISNFAFEECMSLLTIAIPPKVKVIGEQAFYKCSKLQTVSIAEGSELTSIGKKAFASCSALEQIVIPAGVTTIGEGAFDSCSNLTSVTLPESLALSSMSSVFSNCGNIRIIVSYGAPVALDLEKVPTTLYYTIEYAEEWDAYLESLAPDKRPSSVSVIYLGASDVTALSVFNGGGTTSFKKKEFAWGEAVTVEATPNEGFAFLGWSSDTDGIEGADPTLTFTMPEEPVTLVANFFPKALVQGWVDAAVEAKVDGTTLLTPEQAEKKAEEAINEKVAW